ncbi:17.4 kDa class III heat shock protein [Punica granatum]|uniref:SHSP domain-containing protein n=2 Tax=Punica granatum TaxID=22663 RepID=A0A218W7G1_PUNGR|nr:17.4 kDa class III heat shock protein [Punica granatum]OWM68418.1 hypothetical protein CDL15_Pgr004900 [Punica granatum]PKI69633.1 hypothetical protein CRG98_009988 [Punica granatum]
MSLALEQTLLNGLLDFPDAIEKLVFSSRPHEAGGREKSAGNIPVDILEAPKEYVFYMDVPGVSKSDIQVTVEDERTLVIKTNGKRKRDETEQDKECKFLRLERRTSASPRLMRKFRLPEDANAGAIMAKCENGVLTVTVEKVPPPPKSKTVEVAIA